MGLQVFDIVKHELRSEWKQKYAFSGMLLYTISSVFISYLVFKGVLEAQTWNALFWIIILFCSVNACAKSFMQESRGKMLYYYLLTNPRAFIFGKIVYNTMLLFVISLLCLAAYYFFNGLPHFADLEPRPFNWIMFIITLLMGCTGISAVLTLVSAIAAKAGHNFTLMSILSFPLLLPCLLLLIRLSSMSIQGLEWSAAYKYLLALGALDIAVWGLSYSLFPYLWRD
jgi:heme exporter protein B